MSSVLIAFAEKATTRRFVFYPITRYRQDFQSTVLFPFFLLLFLNPIRSVLHNFALATYSFFFKLFLFFWFLLSLLLPLDTNHNALLCALSTKFTYCSSSLTLLSSMDVQVFRAISQLKSAIARFVLHVQFFDRVATGELKPQYH